MQTAVDWLHDNNKVIAQTLLDNKVSQGIIDQLFNCFIINLEQAKEMEKQQIIDAWHNGYDNQSPMIDEENCGQTYYNETYRSGVLTEGSGAVGDKGGAVTSSQTEISDEEIYNASVDRYYENFDDGYLDGFLEGGKWYREQLKSK